MSEWEKLATTDLSSLNAWIDFKGRFFPVDDIGHTSFVDRLYSLGLPDQGILHYERSWVKISRNMTGGKDVHFVTFGIFLSGKQKVTLEKYIKQHKILDPNKEDDCIEVSKAGEFVIRDGKIHFEKSKLALRVEKE